MPKARIREGEKNSCYFLTLTIQKWYYMFDRYNRWNLLAESIQYCQKNKALEIYAYVFMLNHIHLIARAPDLSGVLRDFKKFTSKQLKRDIQEHEPHVLEIFCNEEGSYHFWQDNNMPKLIESDSFYFQKMDYIHNNPVRKGYVDRQEYWKWSSANPYSNIKVMR